MYLFSPWSKLVGSSQGSFGIQIPTTVKAA